jgi:hypothetical protein
MGSLAMERGTGRMDFYDAAPNNAVSMSQSGIE